MNGSLVESLAADVAGPSTARLQVFKVFSATRAKERASLGERVTEWSVANPELEISQAMVRQSSDRQFHCISIVLVCEQR
jgi:hypothetical protein